MFVELGAVLRRGRPPTSFIRIICLKGVPVVYNPTAFQSLAAVSKKCFPPSFALKRLITRAW